MKKIFMICGTLLLVSLFLVGCSSEEPIVGTWAWPNEENPHTEKVANDNPTTVIRFEPDGTGVSYRNGFLQGAFTWENVDGEFWVRTDGEDSDMISIYTLSGEDLMLTFGDGTKAKHVRWDG